jgi:hypothetical protein
MNKNRIPIYCLLAFILGGYTMLVVGMDKGKLTGEVRGMDEEAKIVHEIENSRTYEFRLKVAYDYAIAELRNGDSYYTNDPDGNHLRAMDGAIVRELRRSMLCEDAPAWIKEQLPYTKWWSTNTIQGVPWRWQSQHSTNSPYGELHGPGIDFNKVDAWDIP